MKACENAVEVIYIQHDDGPGTSLAEGESTYDIYDDFAPMNFSTTSCGQCVM